MLELFNRFIKPLNDKLGRDLGIKQIEVTQESYTHRVDNVYITVKNKRMKLSEYKFLKQALGLKI